MRILQFRNYRLLAFYSITLILLLFSLSYFNYGDSQKPRCSIGYHRTPDGDCEAVSSTDPNLSGDDNKLSTNDLTSKSSISKSEVPLQYINHTSNKYQIKFQYPSNWELKEKASRFDEGTDIVINNIVLGGAFITIEHADDLMHGFGSTDFQTGFYKTYRDSLGSDYSKEHRIIEQPSFITIDGQKLGTFLITQKDKYEDFPITFAQQYWLVYVGNHGYLIAFGSTADAFDSPENIAVRDHFIKSIRFLGENITNVSNSTSRFS